MTSGRQQGFTLIELLVVIAIIGILSAVVLASLNTARTKGIDAAILSDLSTIQVQAELSYNSNGYYVAAPGYALNGCPTSGTTMFFTDVPMKNAINNIKKNNGGSAGTIMCSAPSPGVYAVGAKLMAGVTVGGTNYMYWCVDSTGTAKPTASLLGQGASACP